MMRCVPRRVAGLLARCATVVAALALGLPAPAGAAPGTLHRHVAGFSFRYPAGWSVADKEGLLVLQPPGQRGGQAAPTEMCVLGTDSVAGQGIERPDDPRVVGNVERQVQRLSPALRRVGEVQRLTIPRGRGVLANAATVLDFAATGRAGQSVWARAYVCVVADTSVILFGFGLRENVSARDPALRGMVTTIKADPRAAAPPPAAPPPAAGPAAGPTTPVAAVPAVDLGGDEWGLRARTPAGWRARQQGEVALLGHDTIAGLIIMRPHQEKNAAAVRALMQRGLAEEGIRISLTGVIKPVGKGTLAGDYAGTAQGQAIRARIIGLTSPHGGGAWVFAVTTPSQFGRGLTDAAGALARGVRWIKTSTATTPLMKHFAGTWTRASGGKRTLTLGPDGRFYSYAESVHVGQFKNQYGDWTGSWGASSQSRANGRWRVQGDQRSGVIIINLNDGSTQQYRYQVHVEKGKTYWREYKLNGVHYAKE